MPATNRAIIELWQQWEKERRQAMLVQELKARTTAAAEPTPTGAPISSPDSADDEPTQ